MPYETKSTAMRGTKIVATLGPSTDDPQVLNDIIAAGVNVVRLNFSHGALEAHRARIAQVRAAAIANGAWVGIMGDLQGPKIRIDRFRDGKVSLNPGDAFTLDGDCAPDAGDRQRVGIAYKTLPNDVTVGDTLMLDDGHIVMTVEAVDGPRIHCRVVVGGELSDSKGINKQGGGLSAAALTDKDRADIRHAAELGVDFLAVSFPKTAADIEQARALMHAAGGQAGIVAKIERTEAVDNIGEIIDAADVVMIARGDLSVEIGDAELPGVQKMICRMARSMDKAIITATQMMQSMVDNPMPTRAEVLDVANAVMDGTDAVMLSAETAVGDYPVQTIQAMDRVCSAAEKHPPSFRFIEQNHPTEYRRVDEAIAKTAIRMAEKLGVKAIAALTESGATVRWMSRPLSSVPIYAMTRHQNTLRRMTMYRGVQPVLLNQQFKAHALANRRAIDTLRRIDAVDDDDLVIITKGDFLGAHGGTNAMKIVSVGHLPDPRHVQIDA